MASTYTKKSRTKLWIFRILDFLILVGPVVAYVVYALTNNKVSNVGKIVVISTTASALIILLFNILFQKHLRSPIWIVFLGLYVAMDKLIPLIITIGICSILDEFVFSPLIKYYKIKTVSNKAMDERLE